MDTYRGSTGCTKYVKRLKGFKRDSINIKTGAKDYKALNNSKGEIAHASGQERQCIGALILENIVKAFLFTLLSNY